MADDAGQIDSYLKGHGSPLAGLGNVFVAAGRKYGVDPRLMVAISGAESSFGKHTLGAHNAWGWGPGHAFGSWEDAISTISKGLRSGYLNEGRSTPAKIGAKWAPSGAANDPGNLNSNWAGNVEGFMRDLGASPTSSSRRLAAGPTPSFAPADFRDRKPADFRDMILRMGPGGDPTAKLGRLVNAMISTPPTAQDTSLRVPTTGVPTSALDLLLPTGAGRRGKVNLSPRADRQGAGIKPQVVDFVSQVARVYGRPLTIGTGTNHNQFVKGTNRQSQHWTGDAADIPASGEALTRLGRAALIAAGMPPAEANRQRGGIFNVNGHQIIFNVDNAASGGNHFNHLHVGL